MARSVESTATAAPAMKRAAILQPGYLPWLGLLEQMSKADVFVFLDDVQYTKNDWRNRNRIKTRDGCQWLTVPVSYQFGQEIRAVRVNNSTPWARKHLQALQTWYGKSQYYAQYSDELAGILKARHDLLAELDIELTLWLRRQLGIVTPCTRASELKVHCDDRQLRLIQICKTLGCNSFYEGKSGRNYIDSTMFEREGIAIEFQEYTHPYYRQLWSPEQGFISHLSAIDLLFNHGPGSLAILTGKENVVRPQGMAVRAADDIRC